MRKLATIRTIANIKPIPNADRIEVAQIDGWEVIISKSDNFSQGDKVVYIEIDSKMPKTPEYDFLKSSMLLRPLSYVVKFHRDLFCLWLFCRLAITKLVMM